MRIGVAGVFHESNTFAPGTTELSSFQLEEAADKTTFRQHYENTRTSIGGVIDSAREEGFEWIPIFLARANPSGIVSATAFEAILSRLLKELDKTADSLDGLVLVLHGAMVSENCHDVEGKILKEVRLRMKNKPVAVTLDLHVNMSDEMVQYADILVGFDTYPHIDMHERASEACQLLVARIRGEIRPVHRIARPNLLIAPSVMDTNRGPFRAFMERVYEYEQDPEVLNILAAGGFPYADVPFAGVSITVTTNDNSAKAEQIAEELSAWFQEHRENFKVSLLTIDQALEKVRENQAYPAVFIESSDNVGGGAPADATHVLRVLTERKQEKFLIKICDPQAVKEAHRLGVGSPFDFEIGGKTDQAVGRSALHGQPVRIQGRIRLLGDGRFVFRGAHNTGRRSSMGLTAVIELEDCPQSVVILTETRVSPRDMDQVNSIGLNPLDYNIIVVKAAIAWRTAFGEVAKQAIEVDTPGCCSSNLSHFKYTNLPPETDIICGD